VTGEVARVLRLASPGELTWTATPLAPPAPGEVLVRTHLSAVSVSSELSVVLGRVPGSRSGRLGYQTLGEVVAVGEDARLAVGARVVTTLGHASQGIIRETACVPVPPHVPHRAALAVILGEETHKGVRKVRPEPHERVLVTGAGLLGLLTVFNLTRRGVLDVTVAEPDETRRALAVDFGARALHPRDLVGGYFDVGIECSANPDGFASLLTALRPHGRAGVLSDGNWGVLTLPRAFFDSELSLVGSSDGDDYHAYAAWLWTHADERLARLFEVTVTPDELPGAYGRLRSSPRPVSVVVDWTTGA